MQTAFPATVLAPGMYKKHPSGIAKARVRALVVDVFSRQGAASPASIPDLQGLHLADVYHTNDA